MSLEDLKDAELLEKLEASALSNKLKNEPEWRLLQTAADRIVDRAVNKFAVMKVCPDNLCEVIELQVIIRKYKMGLFKEVEQLAQEGDIVVGELKERGINPTRL